MGGEVNGQQGLLTGTDLLVVGFAFFAAVLLGIALLLAWDKRRPLKVLDDKPHRDVELEDWFDGLMDDTREMREEQRRRLG